MSAALLVGYLIAVVVTFRDYGITWDESWQAEYGDAIIRWYGSGFHDRHAIEFWNLRLYGGFAELIAQLATRVSPAGMFETRHFVTALFGLIALLAVHRLGTRLAGASAGFLAMLFLLMTPGFYGHLFNNSKDIPFAALLTVGLYYIVVAIQGLPHIPHAVRVKLGIATGLALAVRIGGIVSLGYFLVAIALWSIVVGRAAARTAWKSLAVAHLHVCLVAYVAMLPWWPAAQVEPLLGPARAFWKTTQAPNFGRAGVFFEGALTPATELPRRYLIEWMAISLPEFYLVASATCVFVAARWARRSTWSSSDIAFLIPYLLLAVTVVLPLGYNFVRHPIMYDGMRHYLFFIPTLVVLLACGCARFFAAPVGPLAKTIVGAALAASLLVTAFDMARLHPYQYVFFNRLVGGGLAHAGRSFETDYWGLSYKEGAEWITREYPRGNGRRLKVGSCSLPASTSYFLDAGQFEYVGSRNFKLKEIPELFLATTRWNCHEVFEGRVVHVVTRGGVPLLYVKDLVSGR